MVAAALFVSAAPQVALAADDDVLPLPVLRAQVGGIQPLEPDGADIQIGIDAVAGVTLYIGPNVLSHPEDFHVYVIPELGAHIGSSGSLRTFNTGIGVGVGTAWIGVTYQPRLLAGTFHPSEDETLTAVGMRNSLAVHALFDLLTFEGGHQFVNYGGEIHHQAVFLGGVNVGAVIPLILTAVTHN